MIERSIAAVLGSLFFAASAHGVGVEFEALTLPLKTERHPAAEAVGRMRQVAKAGTARIVGSMNHGLVDLTYHGDGTLTGGINHSLVELTIRSVGAAEYSVTGAANHSTVNLRVLENPPKTLIEGTANRSLVRLEIDWERGLVEGYSNASLVRVEFNLAGGTLSGYANHATVDLRFNASTGRLTGAMNHSFVDIQLIGTELPDFLHLFYLFLNK